MQPLAGIVAHMGTELLDEGDDRHPGLLGAVAQGGEVGAEPVDRLGDPRGGLGRDNPQRGLGPGQGGLNQGHLADGRGVVEQAGNGGFTEQRAEDPGVVGADHQAAAGSESSYRASATVAGRA